MVGNRRFVGLAVVAVTLAVALSGCAGAPTDSGAAAVALGKQALTFTPSDSSQGGWTPSAPCPDSLEAGLRDGLPAGSSVSTLDPTTVNGPLLDPQLTAGDTATCAFSLTTNGRVLTQLYFIGMDDTAASVITTKLAADGFSAGPQTAQGTGSQQVFTSAAGRIAISRATEDGEQIFIVSG
jgi:hypothetical protein